MVSRGFKIALCVTIVGPVLWLLNQQLDSLDSAALADALNAISLQSIALSILFSVISLYAVARYDRLAIRQLGLGLSDRESIQGGFAAVSIGQTLGMGLLVGSAVRWRMYRHAGVSLPQAAVISGVVMGGFLIGFVVVLAIAVIIAGDSLTVLTGMSATGLRFIAGIALLAVFALGVASFCQPRIMLRGRRIPIPGFRVLRSQISLAALDTIPAAMALWVLIPGEAGPSLMMLIPVYLVALGIGLISNAPGGLGVLELACLMALPVMPPEHLIAALIAHRAIYYGLPALVAGAMLVAKEVHGPEQKTRQDPDPETILARSGRAEAMLTRLGDKSILVGAHRQNLVQYGQAGNSMVVLGDPIGDPACQDQMLTDVLAHARRINRAPVFYKASEDFARRATQHGLACARIGLDAALNPQTFSDAGSSFRELRRKLRAAQKAGLDLQAHAPGHADLGRLAPIASAWAAAKGGERGFSMGYFRRDYLAWQPIIEARLNGRTIGFLSLMVAGDRSEYCVDVMRLTETAPDGTMHALVRAGIDLAAASNATRFSLAAVPFAGIDQPCNWLERSLVHLFEQRRSLHNSHGLLRFKNAFRPDWDTRFVVAPSLADAAIGLNDARALIADVGPEEMATTANTQTAQAAAFANPVTI